MQSKRGSEKPLEQRADALRLQRPAALPTSAAMVQVSDFHAHIYFDADELERARKLAEAARERFGVSVGHFHPGPVGPHPCGSCQLTVSPGEFGPFAAWMAVNRDGLTIFAHASTGDDKADHTRHVIWFGPSESLDLSIFS